MKSQALIDLCAQSLTCLRNLIVTHLSSEFLTPFPCCLYKLDQNISISVP
jgi:hypothetical protein